ncbi:alpha/beta fold hydrolase [Umezawaea tangerina]|uniref:Pimeloyl-ACP methyl ester carboxylesterase n=1 Tax=Umezawaea tangerina TaxID=84725 RepID=A0A2T0TMB0_9PSEU|nr:alpha/beta fold hydrolase [Umezawaea tangerina]PRY46860.1 pimeloyl-ACP methyl ester carboxylesterase [Umezawaea tangerina]
MTDILEAVRPALTHVPLSATPLPPLDWTVRPLPGEHVQVGKHRLHVRHTPGDPAATAVYVHGLGGSSTNWTDLSTQLAGQADGYAPDLPGFGRSEPVAGYGFTMVEHARTVIAYLEHLDRGPVHLLGNSMGGTVAMIVAAVRPDLVRTLALVSPAVPDLRPSFRRVSDPRLPFTVLPVVGRAFQRRLDALGARVRTEQVMRLCFADPASVPEHRIVESMEEAAELGRHAWANLALNGSTLSLFRTWVASGGRSMWRLAALVRAPSLVVWGAQDRLISVRKAPRIARLLPRGRLLVLPGTGHVAQMERPVSVARGVLGMWEAVGRGEW